MGDHCMDAFFDSFARRAPPPAAPHPAAPDPPTKVVSFPPVLADAPRVLILGSSPSAESVRLGQYYGHRQNHFWPVVGELLGDPLLSSRPYEERTAALARSGASLWDVIAECEREGSADAAIRAARSNPIGALAARHRDTLRAVVCNGGKAHDTLARHGHAAELARLGVAVVRVPSTSPAHAVKDPVRSKAARWRAALEPFGWPPL